MLTSVKGRRSICDNDDEVGVGDVVKMGDEGMRVVRMVGKEMKRNSNGDVQGRHSPEVGIGELRTRTDLHNQ